MDNTRINENKKLILAVNFSINYLIANGVPDGVCIYDYIKVDNDLNSSVIFIDLCKKILKERNLDNSIGFVYRIPVEFKHSRFDYKFVGWEKIKQNINELVVFNDAKITFYLLEKQATQSKSNIILEWHKYLVNDYFKYNRKFKINIYYTESKDEDTGEYNKAIYLEC